MKLKVFIKRIIDAAMILFLMSLHTGMHWKLILGMCKGKLPEIKSGDVFLWLLYPGCCDCCCNFFPESWWQ